MKSCLSIREIGGVWKLVGYKQFLKQDASKLIQTFETIEIFKQNK